MVFKAFTSCYRRTIDWCGRPCRRRHGDSHQLDTSRADLNTDSDSAGDAFSGAAMGDVGEQDTHVQEINIQVQKPLTEKTEVKKEDLIVMDRKGEDIVRIPGQVRGNQFVLDTVENSTVVVLDQIDSTTIDYVTNSEVFLGPVQSSVFLRNCENCTFILMCQQLRLRDCSNLRIYLYSHTRPILEESKNITLGCYPATGAYYFTLPTQVEDAKLDLYDSQWYNPYDFTPRTDGGKNFVLDLEAPKSVEEIYGDSLSVKSKGAVSEDESNFADGGQLVPTTGPAAHRSDAQLIAVVGLGWKDAIWRLQKSEAMIDCRPVRDAAIISPELHTEAPERAIVCHLNKNYEIDVRELLKDLEVQVITEFDADRLQRVLQANADSI